MRKQFQKMILTGTLPFLLGLGACSLTWDEPVYFEGEGPESKEETMELDDIIIDDVDVNTGLSAPCVPGEEGCEASDDYLTQSFTQTEMAQKDPKLLDDKSISLSRPAGRNAISVKDKQSVKIVSVSAVAAGGKTQTEETTEAQPGATNATTQTNVTGGTENTQTVQTGRNSARGESATAEEGDKVLYTTIAFPEEIGTNKTTETTLTTTKIIKNPAPEGATEEVPAGMMPLKKTVTTITETTTKVKKEKEPQKDFRKMTLAERVAYGEEIQDWIANSGQTLRDLLVYWAARSGWTVVWKLDRDYQLEAGVVFKGTFVDVSSALIRSFARATPAPIGTFHRGNRVLVISTQEDENER